MIDKHTRDNPLWKWFDGWRRDLRAHCKETYGFASELARACGVSRQAIHRWTAGTTPMPAWAAIQIRAWLKRYHPTVSVRLGRDKA